MDSERPNHGPSSSLSSLGSLLAGQPVIVGLQKCPKEKVLQAASNSSGADGQWDSLMLSCKQASSSAT